MKKFAMAGVAGILAGVLISTQVAGPLLAQEADRRASVYEQLDLFGDIFERIRAQYVEEVDEEELIEAAINGMLTSLDPHSSYLSPKDAGRYAGPDPGRIRRARHRGHAGRRLREGRLPHRWTPRRMMPGSKRATSSPTWTAKASLASRSTTRWEMMRGPVGSEIVITVVREGVDDPFDVSIIRDTIKLTAVRHRTVGDTVVLRVTTFNDQTFPNLKEGLEEEIEAAGGLDNINGVVLDLRNNPGGLLTQSIRVSDAFLDAGEIVSTRGRDPQDGDRFNAKPGDLISGKPIVVLINGGSASASEIVAGALQDHRRAIVVGTKSFGKGSVQTVMPLRQDGAMRLTTARYYTPSGRSIQALGISPDIVVDQPPRVPEAEGEEDESAARRSRFESDLRGSLDNDSLTEDERRQIEADRAKAEEAAQLRTDDYQLAYAIDILKGLSALGPAEN